MDLDRQHLLRRAPHARALRVVERLVGLQAQIPTVPGLSLAARVEGVTPEDMARWTLGERRLLRVWAMRGTMHLVRVEDLPLVAGGLWPSLRTYVASVLRRRYGLGPAEARATDRRILRALERGPMTRSELERAGASRGLYWGIEVRSLAHQGKVVHAGTRDGEALFDLLGRWAPTATLGDLPESEARRRLLLRYLDAYGPAHPRDFAHWMGIGVGDATRVFEGARREIRESPGGGWLLARGPRAARARPAPPRLLPRFDPYVLAHRDKTRYLEERHRPRVFRPAAVVEAVMLLEGRVVGTWNHLPRLAFHPFGRLAASDRAAFREEAERLAPHLR